MSYGREHHDVALQALPKGVRHVSGKGAAKVHHFCIYGRLRTISSMNSSCFERRRRIPIVSRRWTLVVAGNRSISFLDPDGNRYESHEVNKFKFDNRKRRK